MGLRLRLGLSRQRVGEPAPFRIAIAGLTGNPTFGLTPQIGVELTASLTNEITSPTNPVYTWSTLESGTLDTGTTYTPVSGNDSETLRVTVTSDNLDPVARTIGVIRYAAPVNTDEPVIFIVDDLPPDSLAGFGEQLERTEGAWTAPGATAINGYAYFDGVNYTIIPSTSNTIYTIGENDSGQQLVGYNRRVSTGGDVTVYSSPISAETFTPAASTGAPTLSAPSGFDEGQIVTMNSGGETGNPSPSVTLLLLANGIPLEGKTVNGSSGNVTIPSGIEGQTLTVQKTLTSPMNADPIVVTSIGYGPVTAPEVAELDNLAVGEQTEDGLPHEYTVTGETGVKYVVTPTGTIGALPVTGLAAQITAGTVSGADGYIDATLTPLDDNTTLGNLPPNLSPLINRDLHVLVNGGGDGDVYLVGSNFTLNTLTAPIITPISGGLNFLNPLIKAPVITPIEGGLNFGD